jgi:peptidyl-tRNA hydrolase
MTEMSEKKGKLKITVEVEVNQELMDLAKDAMSKMPMRMQEMWRGHGGEKKE